MSEPSMVCNGHKENSIEKCSVNEFFSTFDKRSCDSSTNISETPSHKTDSMTIGTIPFPDFDHLYASSIEETGNSNTMNFSVARSNLNSYHLNIIEEQAKIIDAQNQEISKLKRQNESLIARIERMNRRLNLNQCSRKVTARRMKYPCRFGVSDNETITSANCSTTEDITTVTEKQLDTFPEDIPLIKLAPFCKRNDPPKANSIGKEQVNDGLQDSVYKNEVSDSELHDKDKSTDERIPNKENMKSNFRIKFRGNNVSLNNERRKSSKVVRFVEEKKPNAMQLNSGEKILKRNCTAKTVDEQLTADNAMLFLKSLSDNEVTEKLAESIKEEEEEEDDAESAQLIKKKKSLKVPILITSDSYYTSEREDTCCFYDPITYTPASLEVPSFRTIEKDTNIDLTDVPKDYYEDVRLEAAKERHLRFEVGERKRKKWDVQRIRELRQNERLKEKLRRRKSRWSKVDSPKQAKTEPLEQQFITLFPDIRSIEKIIITDAVPVTALGTSIPKIPSWGNDFRTNWKNNGLTDVAAYEESVSTLQHSKDTKVKLT